MTANSDSRNRCSFEEFGRKLDRELGQAARKLEEESEKIISCLNDRVVPAIRSNSSTVLKIAARQLSRLAELLDASTHS